MGNKFAAVFLDRDGVINYNRPDYVKNWGEFCFLPGALGALVELACYNWKIIIVTNQSVVGRQIITHEQLNLIHDQMMLSIIKSGGRIDAIYVCPHHPNDGCSCRKPAPGLIHQAAGDLNVDLGKSIFIGDSKSDVEASKSAGVQPVLVKCGRGHILLHAPDSQWIRNECWIIDDLAMAVNRLRTAQALKLSPAEYAKLENNDC